MPLTSIPNSMSAAIDAALASYLDRLRHGAAVDEWARRAWVSRIKGGQLSSE